MSGSRAVSQRRALIGGSTAAFVAVGLLRGSIQLLMASRPLAAALHLFAITVGVSLFWVPVTLWIGETWAWKARPRLFAAAHAGAIVLSCAIEPVWVIVVAHAVTPGTRMPRYALRVIGRLDTNLLFYAAIVGALWAFDRARRTTAAQLAAARLATSLADARLHVLTLQLHPHFLFNTLNLISQLAFRDLAAARRTLANLRALLVQSLEQAGQRDVSLRDELRFLNSYLEIQQRRFGQRLRVHVEVSASALEAAVPHLVLQPLVENAIAHGIGERATGGEIRICGDVAGDRLLLSVEDDGVGPGTGFVREGMGLTNTRLRLHQISNGDYRFAFGALSRGGAGVSIAIPLRAPSPPPTIESDVPAESDDAGTPAPSALSSRVGVALPLIGGWAAVAMLWTEIDAVDRLATGAPLAWGTSLGVSLMNAAIWALLTPAVIWMARRFDPVQRWSAPRVLAHMAAAIATAAVHVTAFLGILHRFMPTQYRSELVNVLPWAVWDITAYLTILAFATGITLAARHRESRAAMAATRSRLTRARLASLRLHLQPCVLLSGIDAIDGSMAIDPERAERAITRMGDLLRMLLARADRDTVALHSELAVLRAYLDVTGSLAPLRVDVEVENAALPAVLLAPLAASLRSVSRLTVRRDGTALEVVLRSDESPVDEQRVEQVRDRLRSCLGDGWALSTDSDDGATLSLRVPFTHHSFADEDDDVIATDAQLVVA